MKHVLGCHCGMIPSTLIRLEAPLRFLESRGEARVLLKEESHIAPQDIEECDVLVVSRGASEQAAQLVRLARRLGKYIVCDMDDLLTDVPSQLQSAPYYANRAAQGLLREILQTADLVTCSTEPLADHLRPLARQVLVVSNTLCAQEEVLRPPGHHLAVLASSDVPAADFLWAELNRLLSDREDFHLLCVGHLPEALRGLARLDSHTMVSYSEFHLLLRSQRPDFALAPVGETLFHQCKSNIKFLDYAHHAIPGVFSRSIVYEESVGTDGTRGLLVENRPESWREALVWMLDHPEERATMGRAAREHARANFPLVRSGQAWSQILQSAVPAQPASARTPPVPRQVAHSSLRVMVISPEPLAARMTGPAIRSLEIAEQLAAHFDTTLATPGEVPQGGQFESRIESWDRSTIGARLDAFDVVLSQGTQIPARHLIAQRGRRARLVFDLYDPVIFEAMMQPHRASSRPESEMRYLRRLTNLVLRRADFILCASEYQRDFWAGALYSLGAFRADRAERRIDEIIGVVPFGHRGEMPRKTRMILKGVHPRIGRHDKVLLWGGGVWNWFDPLTLIRAVAALHPRRPDIKLYFLGSRNPSSRFTDYEMLESARALAAELGVLDTAVFFNEDWVEYSLRAEYLLESDLAVCTAPQSLENTFSHRTRLVDAIWCGVPIIATRGSYLADYVEAKGIGLTVSGQDVTGLTEAIEAALEEGRNAQFRQALQQCRDQFRWDRCTQPLVDYCRGLAAAEFQPVHGLKSHMDYCRYKIPSLMEKLLARVL